MRASRLLLGALVAAQVAYPRGPACRRQAATRGVVGLMLAGAGFAPNTAQGPEALFAIRALVGLCPPVLYTAGILLFLGFTLDEREQTRIRRALAR